MSDIRSPFWHTAIEYGIITISVWIMMAGIYFFKFPSYFAFGGVTGFSIIVSEISRRSTSDFTLIVNTLLLVLEPIFLGKGLGIKTVHASMVISISLSLLERVCSSSRPLTTEPLLELLLTIPLPAMGTAILFNLGASSGSTDIIAMILRKYTSLNIGTVLVLADAAATAFLPFIFGPEAGLFSIIGLAIKSLVTDDVIESLNLCKCLSIVCDDPDPICSYTINMLHRSAVVCHTQEVFTHHERTAIMTTMKRNQALKLCNYVHIIEPVAFILISNSSEIIEKGFLAGQAST